MPRITLLIILLITFRLSPAQSQLVMQDITPPISNEALVNPGMGLYLFGTQNADDMPPDAWYSKLINIGYFRDDWAKLQPDGPDESHFDAYFKPIFDFWVKQRGKRVAFRFMSANMHSSQAYVTPKWVFDAGVPSIHHKGIYVPDQTDPVFWDEHYLQIQEKFIAQLGKYLDGRPGLEFIDIGGIGEWGEMHLARWTSDDLQKSGYSETKYVMAYRRLIDAYAKAFPHTRVFLNVGDWASINDYAALRGLHFRQDGLNPSGPSANVGKRFYAPYSRRGVICNYELYAGYDEMKQKGWGVKQTFDKGLEDPISYLHINLMGFKQLLTAPEDVKGPVMDAARRIGFRFVLSHLRCNQIVHQNGARPGRLLLESTWKNSGVAPCYESYALHWSLVNAAGNVVAEQLQFPKTPTTQWWPGEEDIERTVFPVPPGIAPGTYRLKLAVIQPEAPGVSIQLGIAGGDAQNHYDVAAIAVAPGRAATGAVYEEGFETEGSTWNASAGMTARRDGDAHGGQNALLVEGTQLGTEWNYAGADLKSPILPSSRYHLSCWMKVDRLDPNDHAPYVKIALEDANGHWITNILTGKYDVGKMGTWQLLSCDVETTPDTARGQLAIEKGGLEDHVAARLHLDDVRLELLEAP